MALIRKEMSDTDRLGRDRAPITCLEDGERKRGGNFCGSSAGGTDLGQPVAALKKARGVCKELACVTHAAERRKKSHGQSRLSTGCP